jgi:hypothetical protein
MANTVYINPAKVKSIFDEWDEVRVDEHENSVTKTVLIEFNEDPLALVIDLMAQSVPLYEIHTILSSDNENTSLRKIKFASDTSREQAKKIRSYFQNRLVMRRLKNLHISEYMQKLEDLLSHDNRLPESHISVLLKLPDFYRENTETEQLFKQYKSNKSSEKSVFLDEKFTYVSSVVRNSKSKNCIRHYFKDDKNHLLMHSVDTGSESKALWDYLIKQNKPIGFKGAAGISSQIGYEFRLYQGNFYEFF